jgi:hypothetical protein
MTDNIALDKIFQTVTKALSSNQSMLNDADSYNHDHGDHMVEIFQVITQAMQEKKGADPADQLAYASDLLRRKSQSGSAAMYAQNLELQRKYSELSAPSQFLASLDPIPHPHQYQDRGIGS